MQGTMITIGIIYLLICLLIGIWATRKTTSTSEFFIAGQNLGMFVMAIAAFSSVQSGFGMVGGAASTFNGGLGFVFGIMLAAPLGFTLTWYLIGRRIWRIGKIGSIYTLGDICEVRYNSKAVRGWMGVAVTVGVIGYLGTQVQAMGVIMNTLFGVSPTVGAFIGLAILAFYSVGGGMLAGIYTDLFQGILMVIVSIIVFFVAINLGGGISHMTQTLQQTDPLLASPFGTYPLITIVCWLFMFSFGSAGQPHLITKFLMLKDANQLKWGPLTSSLAYGMTTLLVIGIGLTALVLKIQGKFPNISSSDEVLTTFLKLFTHPVLSGIVIAGLLAAIMSTGSSFVTLGAASLVRDIPKAFNKEVKNELFWSRVAVAVLMILSTLFSLYMNTLVALLGTFGWGTFAAAIFPSIVLGVIWRQATKQAAIGSIIISLVLNFVLEVGQKYGFTVLPKGVVVGAFSFAVSVIAFIIISLLTQTKDSEEEVRLHEMIEGTTEMIK